MYTHQEGDGRVGSTYHVDTMRQTEDDSEPWHTERCHKVPLSSSEYHMPYNIMACSFLEFSISYFTLLLRLGS